MDILFNIIGLLGVFLILLAYFLITKGAVTNKDVSFHVMNLIGAILLLISLMWSWNLPSVIIEICWISISLWGLYKIRKCKN
jgi:hypothetical protein